MKRSMVSYLECMEGNQRYEGGWEWEFRDEIERERVGLR